MAAALEGNSHLQKACTTALGAGLLVLLLLAATAPARAATWSERQLGEAQLFAMSCPTESECVAAGTGNTILSSTNPVGGAGDWTRINGDLDPPPGVGAAPFSQIRGVDCPSPSRCVGVSLEGFVYSSNAPMGGGAAWSATDLSPSGPNIHMYGISCPSAGLCVAVASKGVIVTSTDPTGGAGAWTVTQLPEPLELRAVSCPNSSLCVAVGLEGQILSSTDPLAGPAAWSRTQLAGSSIDRNLLGLSCPSASLCVTGNSVNTLFTSTAPTGPASAWAPAQGGGTVQITAVDCPSERQCVAIDNNGDVLTSTDPTGGTSAWTFENLLPFVDEVNGVFTGNGIFGVSCPSASLCAVAGAKGRIYTSTDPFEPPDPTTVVNDGPKKSRKHKGPKRPRVVIGAQPPAGTETRAKKAKVRFRFFAANRASVRGFVCKLDQRPLRPCHSPKTYRAGIGKHVFKVRAVGWTGHRGPVALAKFKVCHPTKIGAFCLGAFSK